MRRLLAPFLLLCGPAFPAGAQPAPGWVEVRVLERRVRDEVALEAALPGLSGQGSALVRAAGDALRVNGRPWPGRSLSLGERPDGVVSLRAEEGRLVVLNEVPLERYVAGVVSAEMPAGWPFQAKMAQAVLARTLAVHGGAHSGRRGETAKAVGAASYYFGAPVVGARVRYNVFSSPYYPWASEDDAFFAGFEGDEGYDWGYRNLVAQGEALTDAAGRVTLSIPADLRPGEGAPEDQRYTVELEAVDASRRVVRGMGAFLVTQGAIGLELEPDRYVYRPGGSGSVSVRALDQDGKPVQIAANVRLEQVETVTKDEGRTYETKLTPAGSWQVRTDAQGAARVELPLPVRSGDYRVTVTARDHDGRTITATANLWVAGESWEGDSYRQGLIRLTFDRKRYQVGEVAKVLVQLPRRDVSPLLTVEGQRLYHAEVLGAGQATRVVSIPITRDYRPNAFVCAAVVDGKASVRFVLPDNLTTWVVKAQAYTASTQVGVTRETFLATKDLLVRLAMPRFLVMGDRIAIAALVHNDTPRDQVLRLALSAANLKVAAGWPDRLSVARNGLGRLDLWVEPVAPGTASLTFEAVGAGASDALELDYLRRYPYGCLEQTTSRFVPEVRVFRTLSQLGLSEFAPRAETRKLAEDGIARIVRFQHADGGWGWFGPDESEVALTAYALFGLREASLAGFDVPPESVRQALAFLKRQGARLGQDLVSRREVRRGAGVDALASAVWALGAWEQAEPGLREKLYAEREALSNYGRSLAALAFAGTGDSERARVLWAELKRRAVSTGAMSHWESGAAAYSWYDGATETTAYAVRAGLAIEPAAPEIQAAVRWLLMTRQGDRWQSTKDTGAIVMALADAVRLGAAQGLPYACEVLLDGKPVEKVSLAGDRRYRGAALALDGATLAPGRHVVSLRPGGSGSLPYAALLSYDARMEDIPAKPGSDVAVRRDYFRLDERTFAEWQASGALAGNSFDAKQVAKLAPVRGAVKSQAKVLVRLTLEARAPLRYMLVEDPLPAGAEVVVPQGTAGWSGLAVRDERVVFFERELASGSHALYYVLRPELPGRYHVLPTVAEGMYAPEVRARAAETRLEIAE